jgi:hypothetical protein
MVELKELLGGLGSGLGEPRSRPNILKRIGVRGFEPPTPSSQN